MHRMSSRVLSFIAVILGLVGLARAAQPVVFTTNTILADLTRQVGGDVVEVVCLIAPGTDPHTYEPKPSDIQRLSRASLVVVNGLGLEGWVDKVIRNSGYKGTVVVATRGIEPIMGACTHGDHAHHNHAHEPDPHAWQDLRNVRRFVENIRDGLLPLVEKTPAQADVIRARTTAYLAELDALHAETLARFAALPVASRKLVTSHDALGYFGHAYGLEIVSVAGLSPEQEPTAKQLASLVEQIRREKVRAVFFENTSNPKLLRLIAAEAGVKTVTQLYTDSLGLPGSKGETFLGMFRSNSEAIAAALAP